MKAQLKLTHLNGALGETFELRAIDERGASFRLNNDDRSWVELQQTLDHYESEIARMRSLAPQDPKRR